MSNTYSLEDALSLLGSLTVLNVVGDFGPYLFHTGCQVDGVQNCTVACQDPGSAFSTLDTLHNCMMYPIIADQYSKSNLSMEIAQLADSLGIGKEQWPSSSISLNITKTIGNCLDAYCDTLNDCKDSVQVDQNLTYDYDPTYITFLNNTGPFYFDLDPYDDFSLGRRFDLCYYLNVSTSQEIGGIGVYISYWIQTGIVLLAFFMVLWWKWAVRYLSLSVSDRSPNPDREAKGPRTRARGRTARLAALTSALVDFHKAQCFFVLAINIAAQVDKTRGGLEPKSLQELYNTWVLIKTVSIGGYLPVTFTLFTLYLVDAVSWYLLSLTICAVSVSIATFFAIGSFQPSDADISSVRQPSSTQGPAACGQHTPGAWCYIPNDFSYGFKSDPSSGAYSMLDLCVFVLFLLMAKQFGAEKYLSKVYQGIVSKFFLKDKSIERRYSTWRKGFVATWEVLQSWKPRWTQSIWFTKVTNTTNKGLRKFFVEDNSTERWYSTCQKGFIAAWEVFPSWKPRWTQSKYFTKVLNTISKGFRPRGLFKKEAIIKDVKSLRSADWVLALFYATLLGLYVYFLIQYCQDLAWFANNGISSSWSFGQIVAITVWAGPLCEYIHLEMRKSQYQTFYMKDGTNLGTKRLGGMKRGFQHRLLAPYKVVKGDVDADESVSDEEGADKVEAGEGEELATLLTANTPPAQPYPSSATNSAYEQVRDLDPTGPERPSASSDSTNSRYDRVERQEGFMPLEVDMREEDIMWQMSDFSVPEREALSYP